MSSTTERELPKRSCIACRKRTDQRCLLRVSWTEAGLGLVEKYHVGRSGYICKDAECIKDALGKEKLSRALRMNIDLTEKQKLREELLCRLK